MTAFLIKGKQPAAKDAAAAPIEPASVYTVPKNGRTPILRRRKRLIRETAQKYDNGNSDKHKRRKTPNDNTHSRISLGDRFRYLRFAHSKGRSRRSRSPSDSLLIPHSLKSFPLDAGIMNGGGFPRQDGRAKPNIKSAPSVLPLLLLPFLPAVNT